MASGALPLELGSSIFFRHDPDRLDVARVVITGPANTPYEGGAFAFDAFCPSGYPEHPPMVNLDTTGGGRARFNPNLYADGKVCLSLLGTWHGGAAEEKWDAKRSTLAQVFVSIQGLIFVDDPMFNEPGFDGLRGLKEGDEKSARYNAEIRLFTIRHAMIDALKKPRRGVGATVRTHFSIKKWSVMRRVLRWCEEAEKADPVILRRTREAAVELSRLLARLE
jgi:baculoviral IAP repeat-containing protein 6